MRTGVSTGNMGTWHRLFSWESRSLRTSRNNRANSRFPGSVATPAGRALMPGRDPDALLCGGCGTVHRPAIPGDWLSGRAPRSHRGGHWFDPSIAHQVEAQVRDSETGPIPRQGTGPSGCLGGIWEINFSLPPGVVRVARCRTVPMAGPASAWWRRWDASSSSSRGTGEWGGSPPGP